jgi:ankyrin repeat protein
VTLLLDRGADIHAIHGAGIGSLAGYAPQDRQPIDLAIWGGPRQVSWSTSNVPLARLLISRAALLLEFGADLSPKDQNGETPLMWATRHGLSDIAGFLKARGAA